MPPPPHPLCVPCEKTSDDHTKELHWKKRLRRTLKMSVIGGLTIGPFNHYWYNFLQYRWPHSLAARVFWEEGVKLPLNIWYVQMASRLLDGEKPRPAFDKVWANFAQCWIAGVVIWVPTGTWIQSSLCPLHLRVLAANFVQVCFEAYSSFVNHTGGKGKLPFLPPYNKKTESARPQVTARPSARASKRLLSA